jgi:heme/copper-type cytochrome/quinol oxidase subunit 2
MSEQIQVAATPIMDQFLVKSLEYLGSAEAFLKSEVPAFIQEFITWKIYEAYLGLTVEILVLVGLICLSFFLVKKNAEYKKEHRYNEGNPAYEIPQVFIAIVGLVMLIAIICDLHTIVKIKVAPRVFLLEEVRKLTR